jgi:hypothetical protein
MRLSMKIGKRIFLITVRNENSFHRPERLPTFLRFMLPPGTDGCGGENLPFRPGRNLATEKNHVSARGGSSLLLNFDLPLGAVGCAGEISCFRPGRRDV